jgi:hypothetical protein
MANWIEKIISNAKQNRELKEKMEDVFNRFFSENAYLSKVLNVYNSILVKA